MESPAPSKKKVALITGITGQDGSYLAEFLLQKGYLVRGIARRSSSPAFTTRIDHLLKKYSYSDEPDCPILIKYGDLTDASSLRTILEQIRPDEVYNLAAQSHVGISFNNPLTTLDINALGTLRLLDAIRDMKLNCKFYQASSSEMFGASPPPQNESTPFKPQSPYGVSKVAAFHLTKLYRDAYGLFASNGILFNHESPRRGINFVTRKITRELAKIVVGEIASIELGNLDAKRDWGFSGEYVQAMWQILQHSQPDDFVIATNETHTVREFLDVAFGLIGLNYKDYLIVTDRFKRPAEVPALLGDPTKAKTILKWEPKVKFQELTQMMVEADLKEKFEERGILPVSSHPLPSGHYLAKAKALLQEKQFKN
jgi:GDPmannose 4,6-dehydratase